MSLKLTFERALENNTRNKTKKTPKIDQYNNDGIHLVIFHSIVSRKTPSEQTKKQKRKEKIN